MASKQQATDEALTALSQQLMQQRHIQQALQTEVLQQQQQQSEHQHANLKHQQPDRSGSHLPIPWHKRRKLIGAIVWGGASLLPQAHIVIRVVKVASLAYVLHEQDRGNADAES